MINNHDIEAFIDDAMKKMPETPLEMKTEEDGTGVIDFRNFLQNYTETVAKMLSEKCDKAWYFDAANLIRKTTGIPVSLMGPCSAHAKDSYEEGL